MKNDEPVDELTPLVDAVATGRSVDWKTETKEFDPLLLRTAKGLQEIEVISKAHRIILHDVGFSEDGDADPESR